MRGIGCRSWCVVVACQSGNSTTTLLKIYIYGYVNRVQSSRRLERECQCNVELMWLTGRLAPDFKTIPRALISLGPSDFLQLCGTPWNVAVVERMRIELTTSALRTRRSPS